MAEEDAAVTGISEPPADWVGRHLKAHELRWFDFEPTGLAEFVRRYGSDPDLSERVMECRRAAWACGSYVQFSPDAGRRSGVVTAPVSNDDFSANFQESAST